MSGKVCKLIPGVSSLKIGYVNEHGQPPWTKLFWHFMFGLCESLGLFLGSGVVFGHVCNLFPGVSSLKIGHVNEHGQPPWKKLFDTSFLDFVNHWCCVWTRGWCLERFVN